MHCQPATMFGVGLLFALLGPVFGMAGWLQSIWFVDPGTFPPNTWNGYTANTFVGLFAFTFLTSISVALLVIACSLGSRSRHVESALRWNSVRVGLAVTFIVIGACGMGFWAFEIFQCLGVFCIGSAYQDAPNIKPLAGYGWLVIIGSAAFFSLIPIGFIMLRASWNLLYHPSPIDHLSEGGPAPLTAALIHPSDCSPVEQDEYQRLNNEYNYSGATMKQYQQQQQRRNNNSSREVGPRDLGPRGKYNALNSQINTMEQPNRDAESSPTLPPRKSPRASSQESNNNNSNNNNTSAKLLAEDNGSAGLMMMTRSSSSRDNISGLVDSTPQGSENLLLRSLSLKYFWMRTLGIFTVLFFFAFSTTYIPNSWEYFYASGISSNAALVSNSEYTAANGTCDFSLYTCTDYSWAFFPTTNIFINKDKSLLMKILVVGKNAHE
jgi:hypothetical protein